MYSVFNDLSKYDIEIVKLFQKLISETEGEYYE